MVRSMVALATRAQLEALHSAVSHVRVLSLALLSPNTCALLPAQRQALGAQLRRHESHIAEIQTWVAAWSAFSPSQRGGATPHGAPSSHFSPPLDPASLAASQRTSLSSSFSQPSLPAQAPTPASAGPPLAAPPVLLSHAAMGPPAPFAAAAPLPTPFAAPIT